MDGSIVIIYEIKLLLYCFSTVGSLEEAPAEMSELARDDYFNCHFISVVYINIIFVKTYTKLHLYTSIIPAFIPVYIYGMVVFIFVNIP